MIIGSEISLGKAGKISFYFVSCDKKSYTNRKEKLITFPSYFLRFLFNLFLFLPFFLHFAKLFFFSLPLTSNVWNWPVICHWSDFRYPPYLDSKSSCAVACVGVRENLSA